MRADTRIGSGPCYKHMSLVLGLDASTQSFSALVIDTQQGQIVADCSINFGQALPHYNAPSGFIPDGPAGEVHADPRMWLDALEMLLDTLSQTCDLSQITAISGAGQQHGSVYLNECWQATLQSLNTQQALSAQIAPCLSRSTAPIWMDTSTQTECTEIAQTVGGNTIVCRKSGSIAIERFSGPQIRRFYKFQPQAYQQTQRIHLVSSFLCSVLCGQDAPIDIGDGAGMNLLNIESWQWDPELLAATAPELHQKLPTVVPSHHIAGSISPYFVEKYGFKSGTDISVFTGDNPSSLVGMGASQPGKVVISLGTSDTIFAAMPTVVTDPAGCGHVFGNPLVGSMSLQCFSNGSLAREAVKDRFNYDWEQFTAALSQTSPCNEGNIMLPFFYPEISPRIKLPTPLLQGDAAFKAWRDAQQAIRACVEGQFMNMKLCSDWMQLRPDVIYLTGGASQNSAIAQIVADIFQVKVQRLSQSGSVALGGAMRAAHNTFAIPLTDLEAQFCKVDTQSTCSPRVDPSDYDATLKTFAELLTSINIQ